MGQNDRIDERTDVFALAVIFYEMLTGITIFCGRISLIYAEPTVPLSFLKFYRVRSHWVVILSWNSTGQELVNSPGAPRQLRYSMHLKGSQRLVSYPLSVRHTQQE